MLNELGKNNTLYIEAYVSRLKQMRHDTAVCEMILTCQLLVGNWSDLHANGLCLLNDVGGCGTIIWGDVHRVFVALPLDFPAVGERTERVDFLLIRYTVYCKWQQSHLLSVNRLHRFGCTAVFEHVTIDHDSCFPLLTVRFSGARDLCYLC